MLVQKPQVYVHKAAKGQATFTERVLIMGNDLQLQLIIVL